MVMNKMTIPQMLPSIGPSISGQYLIWNITLTCKCDSIAWLGKSGDIGPQTKKKKYLHGKLKEREQKNYFVSKAYSLEFVAST